MIFPTLPDHPENMHRSYQMRFLCCHAHCVEHHVVNSSSLMSLKKRLQSHLCVCFNCVVVLTLLLLLLLLLVSRERSVGGHHPGRGRPERRGRRRRRRSTGFKTSHLWIASSRRDRCILCLMSRVADQTRAAFGSDRERRLHSETDGHVPCVRGRGQRGRASSTLRRLQEYFSPQ